MIKKLPPLLLLSFILFQGIAHAQTLEPVVISSMGGYYSNSTASLSFTVAELSLAKTFTSANNMLTQGFQQPAGILTNVREDTQPDAGMLIWPNPTSAVLNIHSDDADFFLTNIAIYNLAGQRVLSWEAAGTSLLSTWNISLAGNSSGLYIVAVTLRNDDEVQKMNYSKINLQY